MKRSLALVLTLASGLVLTAQAQTPAASAPAGAAKVAVIQFQLAVSQTNEFQRDYADLQKKYDPKRVALKTLDDQINTLTKQLQAEASTLSPADQQTRAQAIDDKKRQEQRMAQDDQSDFQSDMQEMVNNLAQKVGAVLTTYARQHGFTVVLDATAQQTPVVLYASPTTDITKAVIEAYNLKSGIPAPPAGPPSAPTPAAPAPSGSH